MVANGAIPNKKTPYFKITVILYLHIWPVPPPRSNTLSSASKINELRCHDWPIQVLVLIALATLRLLTLSSSFYFIFYPFNNLCSFSPFQSSPTTTTTTTTTCTDTMPTLRRPAIMEHDRRM